MLLFYFSQDRKDEGKFYSSYKLILRSVPNRFTWFVFPESLHFDDQFKKKNALNDATHFLLSHIVQGNIVKFTIVTCELILRIQFKKGIIKHTKKYY